MKESKNYGWAGLGRDGVGDVIAVGSGVDQELIGKTVSILRSSVGVEAWGTLAEKFVVSKADIVPVPQGWSLEEMAGGPLVFLTAWQARRNGRTHLRYLVRGRCS